PGRSLSTTDAPASARASASARPRPAPAPVTTATLPSSEVSPISGLVERDRRARAGSHGTPYSLHVRLVDVLLLHLQVVVVVQLEDLGGQRLAERVGLAQVEVDRDLHGDHPSLWWTCVRRGASAL